MPKDGNIEIRHILQSIRLDLAFKFRPALSSLLENIIYLENNLWGADKIMKLEENLEYLEEMKTLYFKLQNLLASARVQLDEWLIADEIIFDDLFEIHPFPNRKLMHHIRGSSAVLMGYSSMLEIDFKELGEQFPEQAQIRKISARIALLIECINHLSLLTDELSDNLEIIFNMVQQ